LIRPSRRALLLGVLVVITGALAGVVGVGLLALLRVIERWVWPGSSTFTLAVAAAAPSHRIVVLVVAGVLTTALALIHRRSRAGAGGVMVSLWERAGVIPLGKTFARSLLSIVDVGLGAALGREGALKEAGAAIASRLALVANLGLGHRRLLVACGTAAGMAAAYNVPLGGALFGLEVLLGGIEIELVTPMIVCCAVATSVSRWLWRNEPSYQIPSYGLGGPAVLARSLLFGAVLGVISALVLKGLRWFATVEQWNARLAPLMPLFALGALGVASAFVPQLLGNGYDVANAALHHQLGISLLLTLPLLRFVATATCRAAQVPGGLFTPVLSIGALIGGLVGEGAAHVWPGTTPGAFALLGMGALLAGTSRGPISSVVLISELSYDYHLILPLVCACGAATFVSRRLEPGSLYRPGPRRRPPPAHAAPEPRVRLHPARTAAELTCGSALLLDLIATDERPLFVVDERHRLVGTLRAKTVRQRLAAESLPYLLIAADLTERDGPRVSVRASPDEVRALFAANDLRFLPVVDEQGVLVGEVCREDFT
jgi:chloride channel protein, CIC family